MTEFFKYVGDTASMGIIEDFSTKTEIYFIGNGNSIREYAYSKELKAEIMRNKK